MGSLDARHPWRTPAEPDPSSYLLVPPDGAALDGNRAVGGPRRGSSHEVVKLFFAAEVLIRLSDDFVVNRQHNRVPSLLDSNHRLSHQIAGDSLHNVLSQHPAVGRSEERRVGKEGVSKCRSRWS